jgi:hypothetical protein
MENLEINDTELIEIQTHIKILNNAYGKFQQQRLVVQSLEEEFQGFFNAVVDAKGGDSSKQWQLDLENKQIVIAPEAEMPVQSNNGTQPEGQAQLSDDAQAEVTPQKPRRSRAKSKPSEIEV